MRPRWRPLGACAAAAALAACEQRMGALDPAGPHAAAVVEIWRVMLVGGGLIFAAVMALALYVLLARGDRPRPVGGRALVIGAGLVFPVVALTALLLYVLPVGARLGAPAPLGALRVEVTGKMWWWEIRYPEQDGRPAFVTANELRVPVGRPVELVLGSDNVIHSFWAPSIAGKMDLIPGHENRLTVIAGEPGTHVGRCAEYCGLQHAWMYFALVALPEDEYAAWADRQSEPAPEPETPFLARGRAVFVEWGCGACHALRGVPGADGRIGPDLSHVGSRHKLAGGLLPNNVAGFAGWIANPQNLKPGANMPAFNQIGGEDLRALAHWLESLE